MTKLEVIELLQSLPDGMRIGMYLDERTFLPLCDVFSNIEAVINENDQTETAFVFRPCCCGTNELPIGKKIDLN